MKLRLETGNFKITASVDVDAQTVTVDDLPKGLTAEDFVGCVVDMGTTGLGVVTQVYGPEENIITFDVMNFTLAYNRLTGKVTLAE